MRTPLAEKLTGVRDFRKILETTVKELGETYSCELSQIVLSNPLDRNITSICEYRLDPDAEFSGAPHTTFPLHLQGGGLGMVSLARANPPLSMDEVNYISVTLNELATIIRHAQINDIVQRDTFRETFLVEINNLMNYSLGIGDALFMVVNILGEALKSSRTLFICVDDSQQDWKCYEYWHQGRVKSCQDYGWPTTDSTIVARSLLARTPVIVYEGAENSHLTPVQEELALLDARSLLSVPLKSESATHGCVIIQQCDSRRSWTRQEMDLVQRVADTVADALAKLPEEKKAREPIMRLHQRTVAEGTAGDKKESIQSVRRALKGALGAQTIATAQKTGQHKKPQAVPPPSPVTPAAQPAEQPLPSPPPVSAQPPAAQVDFAPTQAPAPPAPQAVPEAGPAQPELAAPAPTPTASFEGETVSAGMGLNALLGGVIGLGSPVDTAPAAEPIFEVTPTPGALAEPLDQAAAPAPAAAAEAGAGQWGNLDSIPTPGADNGGATPGAATPAPAPAEPAADASQWGNLDSISTPGAGNGAPGAPPAAAPAAEDSRWGNLDNIPTPGGAGGGGGLLGSMRGGARAAKSGGPSALAASFHKDKSRFQPQVQVVDGPPIQIDDQQAKQKIESVLSGASNATSDYIFGIAGVPTRVLGKIDAWVAQVEAKDKYTTSHALAVAELSVAMANMMGLPDDQVETVRLAAICHDIGKMSIPASILQKPEEDMTEDEELFAFLKHPIDGMELVKNVPELKHIGEIILAHHEEFNGQGYPQGLKGEEIPLAARMINIASTYHGLVTPLKYRPALPAQEAQGQVRAASGKAFDPSLVEILLAAAGQIEIGAAK
jgi:putative nucleotidyltransferase with HDIG domain